LSPAQGSSVDLVSLRKQPRYETKVSEPSVKCRPGQAHHLADTVRNGRIALYLIFAELVGVISKLFPSVFNELVSLAEASGIAIAPNVLLARVPVPNMVFAITDHSPHTDSLTGFHNESVACSDNDPEGRVLTRLEEPLDQLTVLRVREQLLSDLMLTNVPKRN